MNAVRDSDGYRLAVIGVPKGVMGNETERVIAGGRDRFQGQQNGEWGGGCCPDVLVSEVEVHPCQRE